MKLRSLSASFCAAAFLYACSAPRPAKLTASPSPTTSTGVWLHVTGHGSALHPLRFVGTTAGNRREYDLIARSYESVGVQGSTVATLFHVHAIFFGRTGSKLIADAAKAIVDEVANTITLMDNVHARTSSGMTLDCDRLRYDRVTEMVHGEGHVVMTDPHGMRATGNSVDSDITLTRTHLQ